MDSSTHARMISSRSIPVSFASSSGVKWFGNAFASFGSGRKKARRQGSGGLGAHTRGKSLEAQRLRAPSSTMVTGYGLRGDRGNAPSGVRAAGRGDRRAPDALL